jgi:hypothetical protein
MEEKEIWKDIPRYEGYYQVSSFGNVKSLDRLVKFRNKLFIRKGNILKLSIDRYGYSRCVLCINSTIKPSSIHVLVAMSFLDFIPCGRKLVIDHINGQKSDNRVENLRLVTQRENITTCFNKNSKTYSSRQVGVTLTSGNKWMSRIKIDGKSKYLGMFKTEIEASNAYQHELSKLLKQN